MFCRTHYKHSVFSRAQLLCIPDIKKPFSRRLPKMALLKPKVPFWVFPCACWSPYICRVWWSCMVAKKVTFPKTDSVNENAQLSFWTQILFAYFSKNCHFRRNIVLLATTPKHYFSVFFFLIFHVFHLSSSFSNIKNNKNKKCTFFFFSKTLFWHSNNLPKIIFAPLHTICDLRNNTPNTTKFGKTSKKGGPILDANMDQFLTQRKATLDQSLTLHSGLVRNRTPKKEGPQTSASAELY